MISPRENKSKAAQNSIKLVPRLRAFMERFGLSRSQMAAILRTPDRTLDNWLDHDVSPLPVYSPLWTCLSSARRFAHGQACAIRGRHMPHAAVPSVAAMSIGLETSGARMRWPWQWKMRVHRSSFERGENSRHAESLARVRMKAKPR